MGKLKRMDEIQQILRTYLELGSYKACARRLSMSKNTVKHYVDLARLTNKDLSSLIQLEQAEFIKLFYPNKVTGKVQEQQFVSKVDYLLTELKKVGVTRRILWEEYIKENPGGYRYSWFCERLSQQIGRRDLTIAMRHNPGEKMQVDFAGKKLHWIDVHTGEVHYCEVLVAVMPYSQKSFAIALPSQKVGDFVDGINQALCYFGGLPKVILSDNLKSFVTKADRYDPTFNELCVQLATHYQLDLQATRVGKPKDKASVENCVRTIYTRVYAPLRNQEFFSLKELNEAVLQQLELHNITPYQKRQGCRQTVFEREELPLMGNLPSDLFEVKRLTKAKVQGNYHVLLGEENNYYSVPYQYVGRQTQIVYTSRTVEVFLDHRRIAIHDRLPGGRYSYRTVEAHLPQNHQQWQRAQGFDGKYFLRKAGRVGPATVWVVGQVLTSRIHEPQSYNSCIGIFRLANQYDNQRLELAALRCKAAGKGTYGMLKRILKLNLDQADTQPDLFTPPVHDNIRGPKTYQ